MKHKVYLAVTLMGVLTLFAGAAVAQHEEHHPQNQAAQAQTQSAQPGAMGSGMVGQGMMGQGGMMSGGMMGMMMNMMMGQMNQMTAEHEQMSGTMDKLMQSMAGIENEKDPAALKAKLAEHHAIMEQMRGQMMEQGGMMKMMCGMDGTNKSQGEATAPPAK